MNGHRPHNSLKRQLFRPDDPGIQATDDPSKVFRRYVERGGMIKSFTAQEVLTFWFSELQPQQWFNGGEKVDSLIKDRFEELLDPAYRGELEDWADTAEGLLALIVTLDQFPRNIYRGTIRSFAYDDRALELALGGISRGLDETLRPVERAFFYLPLEHSEDLLIQDRSVERYARLVCQTPVSERENLRLNLDYAWRHYEIIKRFGRYPHRNEILGRTATAEEQEFLEQPGSSF